MLARLRFHHVCEDRIDFVSSLSSFRMPNGDTRDSFFYLTLIPSERIKADYRLPASETSVVARHCVLVAHSSVSKSIFGDLDKHVTLHFRD